MRIHQLLPNLGYGDAISNHAIGLQSLLREWGHESEIHAQYIDPKMASRCQVHSALRTDKDTITIYHHSIGSEQLTRQYQQLKGRRVMIYHNITPHHFFAPYSTKHHELTKHGRESLPQLRDSVDLLLADSAYNGAELEALGYPKAHVLPILIDFDSFDRTPPAPSGKRAAEQVNFLFVGRISPNKRQEDLIRVFAWYQRFINRNARLYLVGDHSGSESYLQELREVVASLELDQQVIFTGRTTFAELIHYYQTADLFCCMSEHEGFCVPLLEAMHHGVPVIAYASSAVPETLGDAGVLVTRKDVPLIAEMANLLLTDATLRKQIVDGQHARLKYFRRENVAALFKSYIGQLL